MCLDVEGICVCEGVGGSRVCEGVQWKPWYMTLNFFSCSSIFGIGFNNNGMN